MRKTKSTEEKILIAAKNIFIAKGMAGARMQDIANEAGINKALVHYYFKNKQQLFEVIFSTAVQQISGKINLIFELDKPLFEKIELFCEEYISFIIDNPYLPLFVLDEMNRNPKIFFAKVWKKQDLPKPVHFMNQLEMEAKKGNIKKVSPLHLLINLISLSLFPFVGKPMFQMIMNLDELQYRSIMEQRKKAIPEFIINSIKK